MKKMLVTLPMALIAVALIASAGAQAVDYSQIQGGACLDCVAAPQCQGVSTSCGDQGLCLISCNDVYSYTGARQCTAVAYESNCTSTATVDCATETICICESVFGLFNCVSFSGPYSMASVNPC